MDGQWILRRPNLLGVHWKLLIALGHKQTVSDHPTLRLTTQEAELGARLNFPANPHPGVVWTSVNKTAKRITKSTDTANHPEDNLEPQDPLPSEQKRLFRG